MTYFLEQCNVKYIFMINPDLLIIFSLFFWAIPCNAQVSLLVMVEEHIRLQGLIHAKQSSHTNSLAFYYCHFDFKWKTNF